MTKKNFNEAKSLNYTLYNKKMTKLFEKIVWLTRKQNLLEVCKNLVLFPCKIKKCNIKKCSYKIFIFISYKIVKTIIFNGFSKYKGILFGLSQKIMLITSLEIFIVFIKNLNYFI